MNLTQLLENPTTRWYVNTVCWILSAAILINQSGCFQRYYKVEKDVNPTTEKINQLKYAPNYVILHQNDTAWNLTDIVINNDNKTLSGKLNTLPENRYSFRTTKPDKPNRYANSKNKKAKIAVKEYVLDEVHIYLTPDAPDITSGIIPIAVIPLGSIERLEIYDPDKGATTASYIVGTLGILIAVAGVVALIAAMSSCPFIYVNDGKKYQFAGEIYAGAIYECLERDDYMALPVDASTINKEYSLKIVNQLKEKQYTNLAELIYVTHNQNSAVMPDKNGKIFSITDPLLPSHAASEDNNVTELISQKGDSKFFTFDEVNENHSFNELFLSFDRPQNTNDAKLVLNAKNSLWGDYVFGEFTKLFGSYYSTWVKLQENGSTEEHLQWLKDQNLILKVYLQTKEGWKYIDYIPLVGPLAARDLIVPIKLPKDESEPIKIKLVTGYMLWELDYVALDVSDQAIVSSHKLNLSTAISEDGKDQRAALVSVDKNYLKQFEIGNETTLKFDVPEKDESLAHTFILHTHGYYEHIRDYDGLPDKDLLESFRNPDAFSDFSRLKMEEIESIVQQNEIFVSTK